MIDRNKPHSSDAKEVDGVRLVQFPALWLALALFVLVFGLMFLGVVEPRR